MDKIFGYTWEEIRIAQQKGRLERNVDMLPKITYHATKRDVLFLSRKGVNWLKKHKYQGALDRLEESGLIKDGQLHPDFQ